MNKNEEIKKQVILLIVIIVVLIFISLVSNVFYKESEIIASNKTDNLQNTTIEKEVEKQKELSINGITETQLQNMKGLINQDTYDIYMEYFENKGEKSLEQIEVEKSKESEKDRLIDNGVDYITKEEQVDLENDLQEALQMYGYSVESSND